uniref:Peroxidase n=1 Tax=Aegilops tauschii TaxID=37682 RepID=M8D107_AEGTA
MGSSGGICFRTLVLLLVAYLGGMRAREAPLPLPSARSAGDHPATGPAVLRLFHNDCFVEGCDASILIAPSGKAAGEKVERDMEENRNLPQYGFDTVEMAKAAVESKCPGVVSCADILALAARDAVQLAGGPYYEVKKGRKDSKVSLAGKVRGSLPHANSTVDELLRVFAGKGLGAGDLVALSGAHTIGFAHCPHFLGRLYDFRGTRRPDPFMDARLVKALRMTCPYTGGSARAVVPFDVSTPFQFDHAYYANLQARLGVLGSDQALFLDARTRPLVQELGADKARFFRAFVASMDRMGSIRVKKGKKGEHDDVPRALDPVDDEGEFRQHDGVVTDGGEFRQHDGMAMVMMKLPAQGFA